ncbi:phospholipase, partial [Salmonella enterica subsp. enterica serovar Typhimurium]|nr:phospholipase [Salmonella enterica subsp. enterica]EEP6317424.1 phospholipase [Salmonella enterica]
MFIPAGLPASYCGTVRSGRFFTGGQRKQLVLKTIEAAQHNIRLMEYSFTSPEVAG